MKIVKKSFKSNRYFDINSLCKFKEFDFRHNNYQFILTYIILIFTSYMTRSFRDPNQSLSGSLTNLTSVTTAEVASPVLLVISQQTLVKSYKHRILQTQIHSNLSLKPSKILSHKKIQRPQYRSLHKNFLPSQ